MKTLLSRSFLAVSLLILPGCATTLAQYPPQMERGVVRYSGEELDNLVAPVALYPDALLAQVLVAATFPEENERASRHVRERGSVGIDDQDWDLSVKAIAHYPPVLNMLATQEDWAVALGQAYATQPDDVMDAVQRLRVLARDQGNLRSTPEQNVTVRREYVVIEPANPEVIYVPTYEPYYVYSTPLYRYGFYSPRYTFGIGFPIGPWLGYDVDWFAHRVYYHGWYAGGWRRYQPGWGVIPVYVNYRGPRYVRPNVYVFTRRVNYVNLDRDYRWVRRDVNFGRHDRDWGRNGRNADRDGDRRGTRSGDRNGDNDNWRNGDRPDRGDDGARSGNGGGNGNGNNEGNRGGRSSDGQRDGARIASFDDVRPPEKGGAIETRREDPVTRPGFDQVEKARPVPESRDRRDGPAVLRGSSGSRPEIIAPSKPTEGKPRSNERVVYRGSTRSSTTDFGTTSKAVGKSRSGETSVNRGARPEKMSSPPRPASKASSSGVSKQSGGGASSAKSSGSSKGNASGTRKSKRNIN